jgi:hypothetical protein
MISSLRSRGRSIVPSETSTCEKRFSTSQLRYSSSLPSETAASKSVPPQTTGVSNER